MEEVSAREAVRPREDESRGRLNIHRAALIVVRLGYALAAVAIFALALKVLQEGATALEPVLRWAAVENGIDALGFGWLASYLVLSGSPVAAVSLTLFSSQTITDLQAFAMINGSRLGASLIVLAVGFLYYLRGHRHPDGLYIGVIALLVTATIYLPAMGIGGLALASGWLDGVRFDAAPGLHSAMGAVYGTATDAASHHLSRPALFLLGGSLLWGSFHLFDRALPHANNGDRTLARALNRVHQRYAMFALGLLVTALTLSVSVSLAVLIPLSLKGYIRRQHVIPYIMGANISTFVDTLFASLLLGTPRAFTIVLAAVLSVSLVSLLVIGFAYDPYRRLVMALARRITHSRRTLATFLLASFVVPVVLLAA
ncbi:MAG: hypothetical protein ACE5IZ_08080 [Dehalococcoidia bacterium]